MDFDVDLIRDLLLELERRQTSPRSTICVSIDEEATAFARSNDDVAAALAGLLQLGYIEGAGEDASRSFLFRKLTLKGKQFARAARTPQEWARIKRQFAGRNLDEYG